MRPQDVVNSLLQELGSKIGIKNLQLNARGVCEFRYQDYFDFIIEFPEDSGTIFFYAPLLQASEVGSEKLFLKVLKLNFLCLETNGATFAYDEHTGNICLCYRQSLDSLDAIIFENIVGNFLELADKWWHQLPDYIEEADASPAPQPLLSFSNPYSLESQYQIKV